LRYTALAAATLHAPQTYVDAVLRMRPVPAPAGVHK
jgi:hypothetical protein